MDLMEWVIFFLKVDLVLSAALIAWLYHVGFDDVEFERECRDEEFDRCIRGIGRMG